MAANESDRFNGMGQGLRLPVEGEKNITELTAIARIKPGMYPKGRYRAELRGKIMGAFKNGSLDSLPPSVLILLERFLDQVFKVYLEDPEFLEDTGTLVNELKNHTSFPPGITAIVEGFIQVVTKGLELAPRGEISWLDHLKWILAWAHKERQSEIRKMVTIHYARWVILDKDRVSWH